MLDTKLDLIGVTTNSLRPRANPVCLAMVNNEYTDGYKHTYESMEAGLFQLVAKLRSRNVLSTKMRNVLSRQRAGRTGTYARRTHSAEAANQGRAGSQEEVHASS
jgi:hypothetical protein